MLFPKNEQWISHRISYGETDAMGIVYYAEYLHIFERARSEFIRRLGMSYRDIELRGLFLPVREAQCRYKIPAKFDDLIFIRTGISEVGRASLTFVYEIYNEDKDKVYTTGKTHHACVNDKSKPIAVPDWFKQLCIYKNN